MTPNDAMDTPISPRHQRLLRTRAELMNRLERIRRDRMHIDAPLVADFSDQSIQRQNDEVLNQLEDAGLRDLGQIDHALEHLARGGGNRCECCGRAISAKRLSAMPQATLCSRCADSFVPKTAMSTSADGRRSG